MAVRGREKTKTQRKDKKKPKTTADALAVHSGPSWTVFLVALGRQVPSSAQHGQQRIPVSHLFPDCLQLPGQPLLHGHPPAVGVSVYASDKHPPDSRPPLLSAHAPLPLP